MTQYQSTKAMADVFAERQRQVEAEGYDTAHDDEHTDGSLAAAAACYALPKPRIVNRQEDRDVSCGRGECAVWRSVTFHVPAMWPDSWDPEYWNPKDRRRDLVRAAALVVAEIERLDRSAP